MSILTFGNRLSAAAWSQKVKEFDADGVLAGSGPSGSTGDAVLEIDLSSCRSADFLVLGRLLVLIQALVLRGVQVTVRLPNSQPLPAEQHFLAENPEIVTPSAASALRQVSRQRRQRLNCRLFIMQSGFESALSTGPFTGTGPSTAEGPRSAQRENTTAQLGLEPEPDEIPHAPQRRRGILPFRWIRLHRPADEAVARLSQSLFRSLSGLGLPDDDATALTTGILDELLENVREHALPDGAGPVWALVGGELSQPQSYARRIDDLDPYLRHLAEWAAGEPSPLLRLFVGDSGQGIHSSLNPAQLPPGSQRRAYPADAEPADEVAGQAILTALDHHATYTAGERRPRGLWKVKRVVRSFQGALLVTSGPAIAGHIFDDTPGGLIVNTPAPSWVRGTIVESTLLTAPSRGIPIQDEELPSPVPGITTASSSLTCMSALLKPREGFDRDTLDLIRTQLDSVTDLSRGSLVVGVELTPGVGPVADWEIEKAISSILDIASSAANPAAITLVFAGMSRKLLTLAIDDLNRRQDAEAKRHPSGLPSPILVVSAEGVHYWAGGTPLMRHALSSLSQTSSPQRLTGLAQPPEQAARLAREIRDQPALFRLSQDTVSLQLRPQDAIDALKRHFSRVIAEAIERADVPGVASGRFLTPSQRVTQRWVDVGTLLRALRCQRTAGFLLAHVVADGRNRRGRYTEPTVVRVGSVAEQLASVFSLTLTGVAATLENAASAAHRVELSPNARGQRITVCTDLVSRGSYVRQAVRQLLDAGFRDIAVATVIDGRDLAHDNESTDFISVRGHKIPLASLARFDIGAGESSAGEKPRAIDPITGTPLPAHPRHANSLMKQDFYVASVKRSGAARLGHISRPANKHYMFYISPSVLFRDDQWAKAALGSMVTKIASDNKLASPDADHPAGIAVLYPTDSTDEFLHAARSLTEAIRAAGLRCADPIPVPRGTAGTSWAFPSMIELPESVTHIVASDFTSRTGSTLTELIRIAAQPRIAWISCFAVINGMNDRRAMAVQQIRQVASYPPHDLHGRDQKVAAVRVRYLSRTAVGGSDAPDCSVCSLRDGYTALPSSLPLSLSEHRQRLQTVLAPRSRERAFEEQATDIFGVPITQDDCMEYLTWGAWLADGRFSTSRRRFVVEQLTALAAAVSQDSLSQQEARSRDAFIRLIAAEHHRLDEAPMWFTSVRAKVVDIALALLSEPASLTSDPMLRVQALIVLSHADVRVFARRYAAILRDCRDHETVARHALLEALAVIERAPEPCDWRGTLLEEISILTHELNSEDTLESVWGSFRPAEELHYLVSRAGRSRQLHPNSRQQAWAELRDFCESVRNHHYDQPMWRLQRWVENVGRGMRPSSPEEVLDDWDYCSGALSKQVIPNLAILRGALSADDVIAPLLPRNADQAEWCDIVDGSGDRHINDTTVAVGTVFMGDGMPVLEDDLTELSQDLDRWNRFFFSSRLAAANPRKTSVLTEIVQQCPSFLQQALRTSFDGSDWKLEFRGVADDDSTQVFCSSRVLNNVFTHIRMNAEISHRLPGAEQAFLIAISSPGYDRLDACIYNSASSPGPGRKRGLREAIAALNRFGAALAVIDPGPAPWTFGVKVSLERWKWS